MRFSFSVHKEPVFGSLFECAAIIGELSKILVRSRFAVSTQLLIDRSYSRNPSSRSVVVSAMCLNSLRARRSLRSRSEEHTSELQSLMRISYAVFCLKKKTKTHNTTQTSSYIECSLTKHKQRSRQRVN